MTIGSICFGPRRGASRDKENLTLRTVMTRQVIQSYRSPVARAYQVVVTLLVIGNVSCDRFIETAYFQHKVNEATQEKVAKRYGSPHQKEVLQSGGEAWTYYDRGSGTASYSGSATSTFCRAYVLTFDKEGILRDWSQHGCRN